MPSPLAVQQRAEHLASTLPPLLVAAERVAATVAQGVHGRRRVGQGDTFWQFRTYEPGDSAQDIDWRQSSKSDRVFIRQTEWEAVESVWLWRDASGSMRYRSAPDLPEKAERADLITLALVALLVRGGEHVALLGDAHPPSGGRAALNRLAQTICRPGVGQAPADLPPALALPRHAQVVLIGDFLSPLEQIEPVLRAIAGRGVRGYLMQVLDPAEETLPFAGRTRFEGLQDDGEALIPRVESVRGDYERILAAHVAGLAAICRSVDWLFMTHRTDHPAQAALMALYLALATKLRR